MPLNLFTRIEHILQGLELEQKESPKIEPFPHEKTMDETIAKVENELSFIENDVSQQVEMLVSFKKIIRKIDAMLASWKINGKKLLVDTISFPEQSADIFLDEAERKLGEIDKRFTEIENISTRSLRINKRINKIGKSMRLGSDVFSANGTQCAVDEKFLDVVEQKLTGMEERSEALTPSGYSIARQLADMRANIRSIMKKIPEEKANLAMQLMKLRQLAEMERQSIKSTPKFHAYRNKLLSLQLLLKQIDELRKIEGFLGTIATTVYLEAWVPKKYLKRVFDGIEATTEGKCVIKDEAPATEEMVPTMLTPAPPILEAFEKLTFSFGYPKPNEINPVKIMALTFPLLFGIMFADVGQGAILLVAGLILTYLRRKVNIESVGDIVRYLLVGSGLIVLCGIASISFGFLFGEFFGPSGIIHPITIGKIGPFQIGGFDPMNEPVTMLRFAILVGVSLLSLSLILRIFNNLRKSQFKHTLISASWLWLLLGGFSLWIYWGGISNMTKWFGEGIFMFIGLIIMPVLVMGITTSAIENIMGGIQFSIEILIESLDHTISFGRLAALSLTHSALNYMFLILGGVGHSSFTLQSIPIVLVGTVLALTIEGLIIFVHTLRLHWVEWLPSFYSGKGIPFKPLRQNNGPKEQ